ncbi:hypothetical protein QMY03_09000 [Arthrobacter sp. KFRI-F3372]|uniref:hypothetical protein n=1 Tax=Micrococcaceae TaxID=1268 RepID=UPI002785E3D6|nr:MULTISPECIES: hypothetical protein [Micrococcaceae]MDP9988355.1 hypothetical protein [Arthrobacter oryzae]MEE2523853.1 hypothetical protein [Pseudarthrobacter sp. J47]MEE2530283.1 hypothetical protein [Pseudarthrobacter sp. J75]WHP61023.1 hypothetical protein QMY03_09000 [Arthrobacter sp. KFRI-F3372]
MTAVVNSRVRALGAVRRWTVTGMVLAGLATAGVGAGLATVQHQSTTGQVAAAVQQAPAPAAAGTFGKVQAAQNAPAGAVPQTATRAS